MEAITLRLFAELSFIPFELMVRLVQVTWSTTHFPDPTKIKTFAFRIDMGICGSTT